MACFTFVTAPALLVKLCPRQEYFVCSYLHWGQHFHLKAVFESRHLQINITWHLGVDSWDEWWLEAPGTFSDWATLNCVPKSSYSERQKPNIAGVDFWIGSNNLKQKLKTWFLYTPRRGGIHGPTVEVTTPSHLSGGIPMPSIHEA